MNSYDYQTSPAYLIAYPVDVFSKPVLLSSPKTTIGSAEDNTIQLGDDIVARRHAEIEQNDTGYILNDLKSEHGCLVNGKRVDHAILNHHDMVTFGKSTFIFLLESDVTGGFELDETVDENDTIAISQEDFEPSDMLAQNAHSAAHRLYHRPPDASRLDVAPASNAHERLSLLYQLSEKLRDKKDIPEIVNLALDLILKAVPNAERTVVLLRNNENRPLEVKAVKYRNGQRDGAAIPLSRTVLNWVLGERMALVSQDVTDDKRFEDSESIRISSPNSIVCVPLLKKESVLGVLYIESSDILNPLTQDNAAFAAAVANELALNLENIRLQHQALRSAHMAAIGLTVTNLAHNIKNLIMLNQTNIDLMGIHLTRSNDPKITKIWQRIQNGFERINCLSVDMLDYAREEKAHPEPADINKLIIKGKEFFVQDIQDRNLEFRLDLSPDNPEWLMDKAQLQRALINLIVNAIDATQAREKGIIKISTSVNKSQCLIIAVADNGEGIPSDQLNKICELFYTTKGNNGSGLGLPMVQKFVERMGGKLLVRSKYGVGSSFGMVFPKAGKPKAEKPKAGK